MVFKGSIDGMGKRKLYIGEKLRGTWASICQDCILDSPQTKDIYRQLQVLSGIAESLFTPLKAIQAKNKYIKNNILAWGAGVENKKKVSTLKKSFCVQTKTISQSMYLLLGYTV